MYQKLMITNGILGLSIIAVVLSGTHQTTQAYLSDPNPGPYITCTEDCDLSKIQKYVQLNEVTSGYRGVIHVVSKNCIPFKSCRGCEVVIKWFAPTTGELYRTDFKTAPCKRKYVPKNPFDFRPALPDMADMEPWYPYSWEGHNDYVGESPWETSKKDD